MTKPPPSYELSTWKEIAAHLQVSVRTAQLWEQERGLPVRRLPGSKGRVYMRIDELEAWLDEAAVDEPAEGDGAPQRGTPRKLLLGFAAIAIAALALWVWPGRGAFLPADSSLTSLRLQGGGVVALDQHDRMLWSHELADAPGPEESERYRHLFRVVDLEGDGSPEALIVRVTARRNVPHDLICLDAEGDFRWSFEAGREIRTAAHHFEQSFRVRNFGLARVGDGDRVLVVVSQHHLDYPTQVVALDADGDLRGEYWHAGHIGADNDVFLIEDLDADGRDELYLGGISNARERATVIVLDPDSMNGAAHENDPTYRFEGMPVAVERARLLFDRSAVSEAAGDRYNQVKRIFTGVDVLHVDVRESLYDPYPAVTYTFERDLRLRQLSLNDTLIGQLRQLREDGRTELSVDDQRERLFQGVDRIPPSVLLRE